MGAIKGLMTLFFLFFSVNTYSAIISVDDSVFGVNSITRDTASGIEWLDLTISQGMSYNSVLANLEIGGQFEGWRFATSNEVRVFFFKLGLPSINTALYSTVFEENIANISELLGTTFGDNNSSEYGVYGYVFDDIDPFTQTSMAVKQANGISVINHTLPAHKTLNLSHFGSFLVQNYKVSEPPVITILMFGFLIFLRTTNRSRFY